MHIFDGTLYSPFYIFLKCAFKRTDKEILNSLRIREPRLLAAYVKHPDEWFENQKVLFVTECQNWVHIMDFIDYHLWHDSQIRNQLEEISNSFDVFYCAVGSDDNSYDFSYLKNGKVKRRLSVCYPDYKGPVVTDNYGEPLLGESPKIVKEDARKEVFSIAKSLGIDLMHSREKMRQYIYEL